MERRILKEINNEVRQLERGADNKPIISDIRCLVEAMEVREATEAEPQKLVGYAARFMSLSEDLGGFYERILPGAFARSLSSGNDVVALVGHNWEKPLARKSADSLKVYEDSHGLRFEITPPNTTDGKDLLENIRNGNIKGMSFGFQIIKSTIVEETDKLVQELRDVQLHEISAVVLPAYSSTKISFRSEDLAKEEIRAEEVKDRSIELKKELQLAEIKLRVDTIDNDVAL